MTRMATPVPARKVIAASLGSAIATIVLWLVESFGGLVVPPPVQAAVIVVVTFTLGYFVPPSAGDQVIVEDRA